MFFDIGELASIERVLNPLSRGDLWRLIASMVPDNFVIVNVELSDSISLIAQLLST